MNKNKIFTVREIVLIATLACIQYVAFTSFSFVLYLEVITMTTVLLAMSFKRRDVVLASIIFGIINIILTAPTPWALMYLFIYPTYSLLVSTFKLILSKHFILLCTITGLFSFLTGQLLQLPFILFSKNLTILYFIAGFKVSIPQFIMSFLLCLLTYKPLSYSLMKIKERYQL